MSLRTPRCDITESSDRLDMIDPALAKEPMLRALAQDPIEPMDRTDPTEPIDSTESRDPMQSTDPRDPMLQREDDGVMRPILHPRTPLRLAAPQSHHRHPGA
jgi:hypothetical protein